MIIIIGLLMIAGDIIFGVYMDWSLIKVILAGIVGLVSALILIFSDAFLINKA